MFVLLHKTDQLQHIHVGFLTSNMSLDAGGTPGCTAYMYKRSIYTRRSKICQQTRSKSLWLRDNLVCEWYGVICNQDGEISSIDLSDNNLQGTLKSSIGLLYDLKMLDLSENSIGGPSIPISLWRLPIMGKNKLVLAISRFMTCLAGGRSALTYS